MDSRDKVAMIDLMMDELEQSVGRYLNAKEQKNGTAHYGYTLAQPECKASLERKIITIREQLNQLRKEL